MIKKILIANRGEIAARIIRTCKKMAIATVAIYSEADEFAPYVKMADEGYLIGPPRVNESYMNMEKIIQIAKEADVCAIHPGYGLLSENSEFARKCKEANIIFIGPSANIIEKMGDKITARKLMKPAGVPVIPGTEGAVKTVAEAKEAVKHIGYPVMLKASAGGGGVGLQTVSNEEELEKTFENNSKRAESLFGDGSMFIEKQLENARHIEVQVLADEHGNTVHLFERECSIQRRNQKVIEEAPATILSEKTRNLMGEVSVKAVKELGYTNAGTIEFLVDSEEQFYFLEMNTRIQVEHPITEEITGIDLIEQQINIASGKILDMNQSDIIHNGHAIEARIYAEDPKNFFPSPGKITQYEEPVEKYIRIESSVRNESNVTPFYDPMISKLIVTGESREEAILRLKEALGNYKIEGIKTNIPMLIRVVNHEQFKSGNTPTNFVQNFLADKKV
ncbi:acetyl-CoA carboxylase biotin carboxylase subunit [Pseudogracilibacillus sp. SO30301A]|uniref:acetyl-CoA carboxylase biotin carboxylase subunit n=1 Tax=Pseudogracilibacillus sp. SO30301A TaxID=3098291 RepID=UPI00300E08BF